MKIIVTGSLGNISQPLATALMQLSSWGAHRNPAASVGRTIRYVASDERTQDEVAQALGAAIGQPDLRWVAFTDEQMRVNLLQNGLPASTAADIVAIYASVSSGTLAEDYAQHKPALGKVKLEEFAQEFAVAFGNDK